MRRLFSFLFLVIIPFTIFADEELQFYSQCGQDAFLYNAFFKDKKEGVFIDIGAHDGVTYSNTYFFEKQMGWTGICFEPLPDIFAQLKSNRKAICIQGAVFNQEGEKDFYQVKSFNSEHTEMLSGLVETYDPNHLQRAKNETSNGMGAIKEIKIRCYTLNNVLAEKGIFHVDFMSMDTEGGELEILKSIDYKKFQIDIIVVENNYHSDEIEKFMVLNGYKKISQKICPWDEVYVLQSFIEKFSKKTTFVKPSDI